MGYADDPEGRFWDKIMFFEDEHGLHHLWTGFLYRNKWGHFNIASDTTKSGHTIIRAHKYAWQRDHGCLVPDGHDLHHTCPYTSCCNSDHVRPLLHGSHSTISNVKRVADGTHNFLKKNETEALRLHRIQHTEEIAELRRASDGRWLSSDNRQS